MLSKNYDERIDSIGNRQKIFEAICRNFDLGNFVSSEIIEIGYEDFNSVISTDKGDYFVKIFANIREDEEVAEVVERIAVAVENDISSPKIIKDSQDKDFAIIEIGEAKFRVMVTELIKSKDFFTAGVELTDSDLSQIISIAASLQKIDFQPKFIYDHWAISSFTKEYAQKLSKLSPEYLNLIQPIYNEFINFDYNSLPKSYVHGDMISTNLIKDETGKIWLIDYSVANYTARLNEIAVIASDVAMVQDDKEKSIARIKRAFNEWSDAVNATELEKKSFELLFDVANAIHVMNAVIEKQNGNLSNENEHFLQAGLFGLGLPKGSNG